MIKQGLFSLVIYHKHFCYWSVVCQNVLWLIADKNGFCLLYNVFCIMSPVSSLTYLVSSILSHVSYLTSPVSCITSQVSCLLSRFIPLTTNAESYSDLPEIFTTDSSNFLKNKMFLHEFISSWEDSFKSVEFESIKIFVIAITV